MQAEAAREHAEKELGFWLYLMSDAVIFALLFMLYATLRHGLAGGPSPRALFDLAHTFWETMLLLGSTAVFGLTSEAIARRHTRATLAGLGVTWLLGLGFVLMEISEFQDLVGRGAGPDRSAFLSAFFTLVGTHGLHVTAGLLWLVVLGVQVALRGVTGAAASRLHRLGLFWHFLDIIWIAIFSFVYLPEVL